jgi:hypothetical protein
VTPAAAVWLRPFGIPRISAHALALFRALLGAALFAILLVYDPIRAVPLPEQRVYSPLAELGWVRALAASETGMATLRFVAAVTLHAALLLVRRGVHDWGLPVVTLLALLVVPWGDSPPLHVLRRGGDAQDRTRPSQAYGFAVWLPGLMLGLAFAAAAYAKLEGSGLACITDGTVRYSFVEDGLRPPRGCDDGGLLRPPGRGVVALVDALRRLPSLESRRVDGPGGSPPRPDVGTRGGGGGSRGRAAQGLVSRRRDRAARVELPDVCGDLRFAGGLREAPLASALRGRWPRHHRSRGRGGRAIGAGRH